MQLKIEFNMNECKRNSFMVLININISNETLAVALHIWWLRTLLVVLSVHKFYGCVGETFWKCSWLKKWLSRSQDWTCVGLLWIVLWVRG